jgi:vacuolar protein sorting-associated protein VTA1
MLYTTNLMDKLERFKAANPQLTELHDDTAAEAYVLEFAMEIFGRGDVAMRARRATLFVPTADPRRR